MKAPMRLFTGLDLPAEVVAIWSNCSAACARPRASTGVPPANLHVTTKFIGEWPEERLEELKAALAGLPRAAGDSGARSATWDSFPNPHSPRVFWCGIEAPGLAELAADTDRATAALGIASEKRAFFAAPDAGAHQGEAGPAAAARGHRRAALAGFRQFRGRRLLSVPQPVAAHRFRVH